MLFEGSCRDPTTPLVKKQGFPFKKRLFYLGKIRLFYRKILFFNQGSCREFYGFLQVFPVVFSHWLQRFRALCGVQVLMAVLQRTLYQQSEPSYPFLRLFQGFLSFFKAFFKGFLSFLKAFFKGFLIFFLKGLSRGSYPFFKALFKGFPILF